MDDNARFLAALSFSAFVVIKLTVVFPPLFWVVCDLFAALLLVVRVVLVPAAAVAASCVSSGLLPGLSYESIVGGKIWPHTMDYHMTTLNTLQFSNYLLM